MKRILSITLIIVSFKPFSLSLDPLYGMGYADKTLLFIEQIGMIVVRWSVNGLSLEIILFALPYT